MNAAHRSARAAFAASLAFFLTPAARAEPTGSEELPPETAVTLPASSNVTPRTSAALDPTSTAGDTAAPLRDDRTYLTLDAVDDWTYAAPTTLGALPAPPRLLLPRLEPLALDREPWSSAPLTHAEPAQPPASQSPPPVVDDRSTWAKWNTTLAGVTSSLVAVDLLCLGAFTLLPNDWTGWEDPEFKGLKENFTIGPRVDNDRWAWNYIAHPVSGAEYYLLARNRDAQWYGSFAYSFAMSTFWEFFIESAYEQASWQDLFITPVAGAALGELRWQAKKALENPSTGRPSGTLNKVLYVLIDPFDAVTKL